MFYLHINRERSLQLDDDGNDENRRKAKETKAIKISKQVRINNYGNKIQKFLNKLSSALSSSKIPFHSTTTASNKNLPEKYKLEGKRRKFMTWK